jgi:cell division septation protein DedD
LLTADLQQLLPLLLTRAAANAPAVQALANQAIATQLVAKRSRVALTDAKVIAAVTKHQPAPKKRAAAKVAAAQAKPNWLSEIN